MKYVCVGGGGVMCVGVCSEEKEQVGNMGVVTVEQIHHSLAGV